MSISETGRTFVSYIEDKTPRWYVAFVKPFQEKKSRDALNSLGVENYLPCRFVRRRWCDRSKLIEQPVLPRMIFVKVGGERRRIGLLSDVYGLRCYLMDRQRCRPAVIDEAQIENFRLVVQRLNDSDDSDDAKIVLETLPVAPGDMVELTDGPLKGMKGEYVENRSRGGKHFLALRLGILGTALVEVDGKIVKKIENEDKTDN